MISKAGLAVLDSLSTGQEATPAELATETGYSRAHLYEVLDEMLEGGILAEARGSHNQRRVRAAEHPVTEAYRTLAAEFSHVDWTEVLSPATLRVCWYLDRPRHVAEIADRLGMTRQGVHSALAPLKYRGILSRSEPEYTLRAELSPLLTFARTIVQHEHRSRVREIAPSATIVWCDPKRALVRVQTSADTEALQAALDWEMTGLARYAEYGLQFFLAGEPPFWYAPDEELIPAEIVCHTLRLDSGTRRVSYSMLLIERLDIDRETLTAIAKWYDLKSTVEALYRPLQGDFDDTNEQPVIVPSESEYMALKEQYGVD
ncbi:MarR family transcriptional regulator [Haloplanus salinus]|jgi:DNA-binding MarR family transcriptional regulator|uniref:MarR family transcriptional regulator n=1 Tax=Haloplanus salinus TaxID=1126245 RepID=A0A368N1B6_9EURY|nr:helix-turn-helix domain-containing protein [Haloplanus salinus]RCU44302.1 MarR family transcriptional regulator [Haloplanus salinus]